MNLNCDVVMDLVSIYKDGAASPSTEKAVEEHLSQCRDCRRYYKQFDSLERIMTRQQRIEDDGKEREYLALSETLKFRRRLVTVCVAVCVGVTTAVLLSNRREA